MNPGYKKLLRTIFGPIGRSPTEPTATRATCYYSTYAIYRSKYGDDAPYTPTLLFHTLSRLAHPPIEYKIQILTPPKSQARRTTLHPATT